MTLDRLALLASIIETSNDAIVSKTMEGVVTSWNPAAERMFGYREEEMIGQPITRLFPPDRLGEETEFLAKLARGEQVKRYETVRLRRDGTPIPVSVTLSPLRDEQGRLIGASKIVRDITERKRAEARLREQAESWRITLSSIGDAVIATDAAGRVSFMNVHAETLTGWTLESARGRALHEVFEIVNEQTRRPVENPVQRVLAEGVIVGLANHTVLLARDGREWPIDDSAAPIRDEGGAIIGVVLVFRNVSERRAAEAERVTLLAAERAARAEAERASREKDEFIASLSHELRTPLNAIVGWARMLRSGTLAPDRRAPAIAAVERNAQLLAQLIEDLLDVARIVRGKLRLEVRTLDLGTVIGAAVDLHQPAADAKGVRLEIAMDPAARPFVGDPDRLQQVVSNLLANAIRFTPAGGRVAVALERTESRFFVRVSDTGLGIPEDLLPHIFERFRQGPAAERAERGSLGLGLAIARQLVELHGGTIEARSAGEGRGATFEVSLPAPGAGLGVNGHDGGARAQTGFPSLAGRRVLLVEDDPDACSLMAEVFRQCGAQVAETHDASEALARFEGAPFDVLVSDIGLPGQDGYELIRTIRGRAPERGGRIPALAVTAFARVEDRRRALLAGFQTHLSKPVEPLELAIVVSNLLGTARAPR